MLQGKERCEGPLMVVSYPLRPPFWCVQLLVIAGVARCPWLTALGSLSSQQLLLVERLLRNPLWHKYKPGRGHFIPGAPLTTRPVDKYSPLHVPGGGYQGPSNSSPEVPGLTEHQWSTMAAGSVTHSWIGFPSSPLSLFPWMFFLLYSLGYLSKIKRPW